MALLTPLLLLALACGAPALAQADASLEGRVVRPDGAPVAGVLVVLQPTGAVEWTTPDGAYAFRRLAPGDYTILLTLGNYSTEIARTAAAGAAPVATTVDWPLSFVETMVVAAPSRQLESIAYAPAAVSTIDARALSLTGHGQLPLVLASSPGVQVAQSGLFDVNLNARGFNDLVNRRVRVEIDGRDASQPHVMGNTDWGSVASSLGEFEQVEFVRGPGGALYGVGALNGVMTLRSKDPAASLGGSARVTAGQLDTLRFDARHAARLREGWHAKVVGGYQQSDDFAVSRDRGVEYAPGTLGREAVKLDLDRVRVAYGQARIDWQVADGQTLTAEAGSTYKEGTVTLTNLGRYQARNAHFPWARVEYRSPRWRWLGAMTTADIDDQLALATGQGTYQSGKSFQAEGSTHRAFATGRGRIIAGATLGHQRVDSADLTGQQTIFEEPQQATNGAGFGQVEFDVSPRFRVNGAVRLDASTLTRTTVSPRVAAMFEIAPGQRLRLAYSDAFKAPTIVEKRLRAAVAPPLDLSPIEAALAPLLGSTPLGFASVPIIAVGNDALDVEEVHSVEAGYNVVLGRNTFAQAVYYANWHSTFTSGLVPRVGTSLGFLNTDFMPYRPPAALSTLAAVTVRQALFAALPLQLFDSMSNLSNGAPVIALLSLGNFGTATTQGLELSTMTMVGQAWRVDASYAWFRCDIDSAVPEARLAPNTPSHQGSVGATYTTPRVTASGRLRLVDGFEWVSGVYAGRVPSYAIADAQVTVPLTSRWTVGLDVANLFDNVHYEVFGGDLLRRRAVVHATATW